MSRDFWGVLKELIVPWLRSSANEVQTNMFCCCLIVNYGVVLHCTCYTIVCILPWCPAVYKTSTALIQSIDTITGIPFCFSELLISFACDLKGPSQSLPFSMTSKLLIKHGEANSSCFTVSCVPEGMFNYLE